PLILAGAAPFVRLNPDPATLLVMQSIVLALGAVPAYCLGRRVWAEPSAGVVTAGVYLLYPPLQFANLFDFHADTFATPILLAAFASIFAGRTGWALGWACLLMLVVPLAGLPLLAPEVLAVGLPPLVSNLLSTNEMQYTIRAQYTATLTPILIAAAVVGGRRAAVWVEERGWSPGAVLAAMAATRVIASVTFSPLPWSHDPFAPKEFWDMKPRPGVAAI